MYAIILLAGFCGGAVRGLVGFLKYKFSYKNVPFKIYDFLGTVLLSGLIGLGVSWAVKGIGFELGNYFSPALSFVVAYAGGDFIENVYKIIIKKSSLYKNYE